MNSMSEQQPSAGHHSRDSGLSKEDPHGRLIEENPTVWVEQKMVEEWGYHEDFMEISPRFHGISWEFIEFHGDIPKDPLETLTSYRCVVVASFPS